MLDVIIFAVKLSASIGIKGPLAMLGYLAVAGFILTLLRKPVAGMTIVEQRNEGEFRHINARLITNCEEVAFYQGHKREEQNITNSFARLVNHCRNFILFRFSMGFIDNIVAKCKLFYLLYLITCFLTRFNIRFCHIHRLQCRVTSIFGSKEPL